MAKAIGPTFAGELAAAGLFPLPLVWGDDGSMEFGPGATAELIAAVKAVYAAHDPARRVAPVAAGVSADDLAAALVAKGVIRVADLPARAQAAAAAAVATIALEDGPAVALGAPAVL